MEHSSLDPKKAVTFDLATGQVRLASSTDNTRSVIVPAAALGVVIAAAGEVAARDLGHALGKTLGERLRAKFDVREATAERVTTELATELATVGLGTLSFERWGRALCVLLAGSPFEGKESKSVDAFLASTVESAIASATGRELRALPLARDEGTLRMLLGNVASVERVTAWMTEGASWGDAIGRLHGASS